MDPGVMDAIPKMVHDEIVDENTASGLFRIDRGELLSLHPELRLLSYLKEKIRGGSHEEIQ
jgi:hypothetical protein